LKILVTGSSGFIGSHLVHSLNYSIRVVQRYVPKHHNTSIEYYFIKDFVSFEDWRDLLKDIDVVVHLIGLAHHKFDYSPKSFSKYLSINFHSTINFAKSASKLGIKRFIYLSSAGVYGDHSSYPLSEDFLPKPLEPYAVSKLIAEKYLLEISSKGEMDVIIIRPPLIYGSEAPGNFARLRQLGCLGFPLPFSCISNLRSFLGIDNLINFISHCIDHPLAGNQVFNVSDDNDISTVAFMNLIYNALDKQLILFPIPENILSLFFSFMGKKDEYVKLTKNFQLDISKSKDLINWKPKFSIEEQLTKALS
jgi:nucleoside-diphosphate-sugar epimerase